jgi:prepilin-type N-terminal cleavage/methylation domain-containing protein
MAKAFTLIEVMVVVLLLALAAATVTLRLAGPKQRADFEDAADSLRQWDFLTRQFARTQGRAIQIVLDLDDGKVSRLCGGDREESAALALPEPCRLEKVLVRGLEITHGRAAICCSANGFTPTYAVQLAGRGRKRALLFAGLTGQAVEVEDERELQEAISLLEGGRPDPG